MRSRNNVDARAYVQVGVGPRNHPNFFFSAVARVDPFELLAWLLQCLGTYSGKLKAFLINDATILVFSLQYPIITLVYYKGAR